MKTLSLFNSDTIRCKSYNLLLLRLLNKMVYTWLTSVHIKLLANRVFLTRNFPHQIFIIVSLSLRLIPHLLHELNVPALQAKLALENYKFSVPEVLRRIYSITKTVSQNKVSQNTVSQNTVSTYNEGVEALTHMLNSFNH